MPELLKAAFHKLADGGRIRYALINPSQKPRGTILVANGRREFIEKRYAELGETLQKRGFQLIFFEWRGQGLSTRFLKGTHYQRDYIADFNIYLDDLRSFYRQVVVPLHSGSLIACGHSLGGHLLLRWIAEDQPVEVKATLLTAPMLALTLHTMQRVAQTLCRIAVHTGYGEGYAPGQHDYNEQDRLFTGNPLTHDAQRYTIIERYFTGVPEMMVGGVTWQWLYAALHSMHKTEAPEYLAAIKTPVLTIIGDKDHVTPAAQLVQCLKSLPNSETVILPGALHDVMNEIDTIRAEAWAHIDRFLAGVIED